MKTRILSGLVAVFCIFITDVQAQDDDFSFNQGQAEQTNYYVRIPYQDINGKIVIEVSLNGKLRKFILDTGSPMAISGNLFDEMKPAVLKNLAVADANGVEDSAKVVSLSGINIGGTVFNNVPAIVKDWEAFSCIGVDGLIGSNLFRNSIIQFNSNEKTITLTDNDSDNPYLAKGISAQMQLHPAQSTPIIKIYLLNDKKQFVYHEVIFDTGDKDLYSVSVDNYRFFEENAPGLFKKYAETEGIYNISLNKTVNQQHYLLGISELVVNGISFKNVIAKTTHNPNSRIGSSILNSGIVTLDFIHATFYLCPVVNASPKTWSVDGTLKDGKFVVGAVWDKSLKDKVNLGDRILKIADIDYTLFNLCDFINGNTPTVEKTDTATMILEDINTGQQKSVQIFLIK